MYDDARAVGYPLESGEVNGRGGVRAFAVVTPRGVRLEGEPIPVGLYHQARTLRKHEGVGKSCHFHRLRPDDPLALNFEIAQELYLYGGLSIDFAQGRDGGLVPGSVIRYCDRPDLPRPLGLG